MNQDLAPRKPGDEAGPGTPNSFTGPGHSNDNNNLVQEEVAAEAKEAKQNMVL